MDYAAALRAYLATAEGNQADFAERIGTTQASISRYSRGRLPPREIAEKIDDASSGQVPLGLWIVAASKKIGLAA